MKKITGIYKIINKKTNKIYIGSSFDIEKRFIAHIKLLEKGTHHSHKLQYDWDLYEKDDFLLELVEEQPSTITSKQLREIEQEYVNKYDSFHKGYNGTNRIHSKKDSISEDYLTKEERDYSKEEIHKILQNKKISFQLLIHLYCLSNWNEGEDHRYLYYHALNKTQTSKHLRMGKATLDKRLKDLAECGMIKHWIKKEKDGREIPFILLPNVGDYYTLINLNTNQVKSVMNVCDEVLVRTFLFHKSFSDFVTRKHNGEDGVEYTVRLEYIAETIGVATSHLHKIIDSHRALEMFGTISIRKTYEKNPINGATITKNNYTFIKQNFTK